MTYPKNPIVGSEVADRSKLRPPAPVRDLNEFLDFLVLLEALFGPIRKEREPTTVDRFLL